MSRPREGGPGPAFWAAFSDEHDALRAALRLRHAGCRVLDVYGPYPIHGIEKALGLAPSRLPAVCAGLGAFGAVFAFAFQTWVSTVDWPVRIGGKPFYAWPSFLPIAFELMVLLAGVGTVLALLVTRRLLPWRTDPPAFSRVTDDRFVVAVDRRAPGFDPEESARLCRRCGAVELSDGEAGP